LLLSSLSFNFLLCEEQSPCKSSRSSNSSSSNSNSISPVDIKDSVSNVSWNFLTSDLYLLLETCFCFVFLSFSRVPGKNSTTCFMVWCLRDNKHKIVVHSRFQYPMCRGIARPWFCVCFWKLPFVFVLFSLFFQELAARPALMVWCHRGNCQGCVDIKDSVSNL